MKRSLLQAALLSFAAFQVFAGQPATAPEPTLYIQADHGFEVDIVAGIYKKHVPVKILLEKTPQADYILTANPVRIHKQTTGSKVLRCIFVYCAGIQDTSSVAVQLIDTQTHQVVWGYSVTKADYGRKWQSMAEAIAKHLKRYLQRKAKPDSQVSSN